MALLSSVRLQAPAAAVPRLVRVPGARPTTRSIQARSQPSEVDSALAEAQALLASIGGGSSGSGSGSGAPAAQQDAITALGYTCDDSGCVLVLPESSYDEEPVQLTTLAAGAGWAIGIVDETEDEDHPALIAGATWALPLTHGELGEVAATLRQVAAAAAALHAQGQWLPVTAGRPASRAKRDSRHFTLQATWAPGGGGERPGFSVEVTLQQALRTVSVTWEAEAVAEVLAVLGGDAAAAGGGGAPAVQPVRASA